MDWKFRFVNEVLYYLGTALKMLHSWIGELSFSWVLHIMSCWKFKARYAVFVASTNIKWFVIMQHLKVAVTVSLPGELYDDAETNTLEVPEKKRHKRPAGSSSRHIRRSASAEMVDKEPHDGENISPTRRRQRRKRVHGQLAGTTSIC